MTYVATWLPSHFGTSLYLWYLSNIKKVSQWNSIKAMQKLLWAQILIHFVCFSCEGIQYQYLNIFNWYIKMVATLLEGVAMDAYNKILPWFKRRSVYETEMLTLQCVQFMEVKVHKALFRSLEIKKSFTFILLEITI